MRICRPSVIEWSVPATLLCLVMASAHCPAAEQVDFSEVPIDEDDILPQGLNLLFSREAPAGTAPPPLRMEPVAKSIDAIAQTPWKTPAYDTTARLGIVVSQKRKLPWGLETEWRVGVAAQPHSLDALDFEDASLWSIKTGIGDKFYVYLHDKGSGFVRYFGDSLSVYGRVLSGTDKGAANSTLQVGAARSF